jgi:RNase H-fold protein (predicted Holliday junction resolvase)
MESQLILAIDPGTEKIGWAAVDQAGAVAGQGIVRGSDWDKQLGRLIDIGHVRVVVIGNGTNRVNIEQGLTRLLPQVPIVPVDETGSTVDAWILKREELSGRNPLKHLWFTLVQLFGAGAVDDYAARVLARRYLSALRRQPD